MDRQEIIDDIKRNGGAEIASLQYKFGLTYRQAKALVDELLAENTLEFASGLRYNYIKDDSEERLRRYRENAIRDIRRSDDGDDGIGKSYQERRDYLEARRMEILKRMKAVEDEEDEDGEEDDDEDDDENEKDDEDNDLFGDLGIDDDDDDDDDFDEKMEEEKYESIIERIFGPDKDEYSPEERAQREKVYVCLLRVLNKIIERKSAPVPADVMPEHPSWTNRFDFERCVLERMERIIRSDKRMGWQGAVKKAETYLEAVRDTHDGKMEQVYERLVYELKNTGNYLYRQLKKQFFGEE